jgi:hypothetical protein
MTERVSVDGQDFLVRIFRAIEPRVRQELLRLEA